MEKKRVRVQDVTILLNPHKRGSKITKQPFFPYVKYKLAIISQTKSATPLFVWAYFAHKDPDTRKRQKYSLAQSKDGQDKRWALNWRGFRGFLRAYRE